MRRLYFIGKYLNLIHKEFNNLIQFYDVGFKI